MTGPQLIGLYRNTHEDQGGIERVYGLLRGIRHGNRFERPGSKVLRDSEGDSVDIGHGSAPAILGFLKHVPPGDAGLRSGHSRHIIYIAPRLANRLIGHYRDRYSGAV